MYVTVRACHERLRTLAVSRRRRCRCGMWPVLILILVLVCWCAGVLVCAGLHPDQGSTGHWSESEAEAEAPLTSSVQRRRWDASHGWIWLKR